MSEKLLSEKKDGVLVLTLNNPPVNILTAALMNELAGALEGVNGQRELLAVVIRAAGRAFSAGADVGEHHPEKAASMMEGFGRLFTAIGRLELPLVMVVEGAALGAGFELAMAGDIILASEKASFGQPEIRLGFFAPLAVAWLPRLVGWQKAVEATCTGRSYSAAEMAARGLVNQVLKPEEVNGALEALLADLRKASPAVMRLNMRLMKKLRQLSAEEAHREAEQVFVKDLMQLKDVLEGIASFYEKRLPRWKNG